MGQTDLQRRAVRNFMLPGFRILRVVAAATLFIGICGTEPAHAGKIYSFGVVPQFEPGKLFSIWKPILRELERRSGLRLRMVGTPEIPRFEHEFLKGAFDFAYMNPYHAFLAMRKSGYLPLVRDGSRSLFGVVVVRNDSALKEIQDLDGHDIAFPAPNALGASLMVRADLARVHGVRFRPVYVQTHSSVYLRVVMGLEQAGGGVMSTLLLQPAEIRKNLRIIYQTRTIAPHPVTAHPRVPRLDREKLRQAFLQMANTGAGRALLAKVPMGKAVTAVADDYAGLAELGLETLYRKQRP